MNRIKYFSTALTMLVVITAVCHAQKPIEVGHSGPPPVLVSIPVPDQPNALPLYPSGAPKIENASPAETWGSIDGHALARNVTQPTITPFLPDKARATGAAVVVAPGGGFVSLAMDIEGWQVARWLADHGVAAFVLKYRLNPTPADPVELRAWEAERRKRGVSGVFVPALEDGIEAIRYVRSHADAYGVDPKRVGMIGFSAGAMNTLQVALANKPESRPAFIGLIYGPFGAVTPPVEAQPLFAAIAMNDPMFSAQDLGIVKPWRAAGGAVEVHIYQTGGHGFGMLKNGTTTEMWTDEFLAWLRMNKFVPPDTAAKGHTS